VLLIHARIYSCTSTRSGPKYPKTRSTPCNIRVRRDIVNLFAHTAFFIHTLTTRFQLAALDTSGQLRLRLQQSLHIRVDGEVIARLSSRLHAHPTDMEAKSPQESRFQVQYMELTRLRPGESQVDHGMDAFFFETKHHHGHITCLHGLDC